jgi:heme-degrading monooxygenase HmoA
MIAVLFEVELAPGRRDAYLGAAETLRPLLAGVDGFISIERFESLSRPGRLLSLSFWESEEAVQRWRTLDAHRAAQQTGRASIFADYRLTVAEVIRGYGLTDRDEAPEDSRVFHGSPGQGPGRL